MKKLILIAAIVLATVSALVFWIFSPSSNVEAGDLREGDIVFIESQSNQSPYIKLGTMSKWTHCGVVVKTSSGLQVLEASKTVRLTPYEKFISKAKNGNHCVKRPEQTFFHALQNLRAHKYAI